MVDWCYMCKASGGLWIIYYCIVLLTCCYKDMGMFLLPLWDTLDNAQHSYKFDEILDGKVRETQSERSLKDGLLCVMWNIWKERNARIFFDLENSVVKLKNRCVRECCMTGWPVFHIFHVHI